MRNYRSVKQFHEHIQDEGIEAWSEGCANECLRSRVASGEILSFPQVRRARGLMLHPYGVGWPTRVWNVGYRRYPLTGPAMACLLLCFRSGKSSDGEVVSSSSHASGKPWSSEVVEASTEVVESVIGRFHTKTYWKLPYGRLHESWRKFP